MLCLGGIHVRRPFPGVGEGVELGLAGFARGLLEQDVVVGVGIERRVEINEVNARVGEDLRVPQPFQVVAEQQAIGWLRRGRAKFLLCHGGEYRTTETLRQAQGDKLQTRLRQPCIFLDADTPAFSAFVGVVFATC